MMIKFIIAMFLSLVAVSAQQSDAEAYTKDRIRQIQSIQDPETRTTIIKLITKILLDPNALKLIDTTNFTQAQEFLINKTDRMNINGVIFQNFGPAMINILTQMSQIELERLNQPSNAPGRTWYQNVLYILWGIKITNQLELAKRLLGLSPLVNHNSFLPIPASNQPRNPDPSSVPPKPSILDAQPSAASGPGYVPPHTDQGAGPTLFASDPGYFPLPNAQGAGPALFASDPGYFPLPNAQGTGSPFTAMGIGTQHNYNPLTANDPTNFLADQTARQTNPSLFSSNVLFDGIKNQINSRIRAWVNKMAPLFQEQDFLYKFYNNQKQLNIQKSLFRHVKTQSTWNDNLDKLQTTKISDDEKKKFLRAVRLALSGLRYSENLLKDLNELENRIEDRDLADSLIRYLKEERANINSNVQKEISTLDSNRFELNRSMQRWVLEHKDSIKLVINTLYNDIQDEIFTDSVGVNPLRDRPNQGKEDALALERAGTLRIANVFAFSGYPYNFYFGSLKHAASNLNQLSKLHDKKLDASQKIRIICEIIKTMRHMKTYQKTLYTNTQTITAEVGDSIIWNSHMLVLSLKLAIDQDFFEKISNREIDPQDKNQILNTIVTSLCHLYELLDGSHKIKELSMIDEKRNLTSEYQTAIRDFATKDSSRQSPASAAAAATPSANPPPEDDGAKISPPPLKRQRLEVNPTPGPAHNPRAPR